MRYRSLGCWPATACLVLLAGSAPLAFPQQFTGTIQGIVQDATSAVLPGAAVSVIDINTNDERHATTGRDGAYVVPQLKPGTYRVVVELAGFKTATVDQIKLDVQQIRAVDVRLDVGGTSESVMVLATAAPVATVSSTISQNIENKRIVDLPLNGRNPFSLAALSPGVIPAPRFVAVHQRRPQRDQRGDHRRHLERQCGKQRVDSGSELHAVGRCGAGVQRPDQRRQRGVRPSGRRRHQPRHQERHQPVPRNGI